MPCVFKTRNTAETLYIQNEFCPHIKTMTKQSVGSLTEPNNVHIRIDRREREKSLHFEQCPTIIERTNRIKELSNSFIELFNCNMEMSLTIKELSNTYN